MINAHELLCRTLTTMHHEDSWLSVAEAIEGEDDLDALKFAVEELLVIAAGFAITASGALGQDVLGYIDENFEHLRGLVAEQDD